MVIDFEVLQFCFEKLERAVVDRILENGKTVSLEESIDELTGMNSFRSTGLTVIDRF